MNKVKTISLSVCLTLVSITSAQAEAFDAPPPAGYDSWYDFNATTADVAKDNNSGGGTLGLSFLFPLAGIALLRRKKR